MFAGVCNSFIIYFSNWLRIFSVKQFNTAEKNIKYFFKLDGYYYCSRKKSTIVIFRVRNKRTIYKIELKEIINDKDYLKELHPVDACILGILANNERNGIVNKNHIGWRKMNRSKAHMCSLKTESFLEVTNKYTDTDGNEIIILRAKHLDKEIKITTIELCKNQALLYALDSFQAISLGYDASEFIFKNINKGVE